MPFASFYAIAYVRGEKILCVYDMVNDIVDSPDSLSSTLHRRPKPVFKPLKSSIIRPVCSEIIP